MIYHGKRPILYVDDTVEQRYAMRRILEIEGHQVIEAGTGREALAKADRPLSLAVVDVKLPDIDGYDLSRELKHIQPSLPILQVSASFSDANLRAAGLSGGADAYIAQPVHPSELIALIKRMLQTSEAEESLRFLAEIGPQMTSTLSFPEAAENICRAIMRHFAADCILFLKRDPLRSSPFWSQDLSSDSELRQSMESLADSDAATTVHSRLIIAPLRVGGFSIGAIAFCLDSDREYTSPDQSLARDLASRAALSLQNCILFASEQATRSALIQAEKLATAGRLSAAIAHEINNPLEALTNLIYIIEQSPEASDPIRETASAALAEITRLAHITRQSLGFYREPSTPSLLDISHIVEDTLELYRRRLDSKRIHVDLALQGKVEINGSAGEIRQVISNLVVNALESMDMDGSIELATFVRESVAVLSVSDTGPGIHPDTLSQIFDAFYTTKQGTGTGLGLWIVKKIVEKHGGKISVASTISPPMHGTTFEVEFPLAQP